MIYPLFTQILNMGITASFVMIVVLLIRCLMHNLPKKYCYLLWAIVGIRLVCPIAISSPVSLFNVIGTDFTNIISMEASGPKTNSSKISKTKEPSYSPLEGMPEDQLSENTTGNMAEYLPAPSMQVQKEAPSLPILNAQEKRINPVIKYGSILWLTGMMLIFLYNFYMTFCIKKHLEKAVRYKENIYECENIPSPFVIGILHPRIYIPFQLDTKEQEYILKHELYHIKRRDYMIKPAAFLLVCVYWFHPLVWLSYFLMIRDMEMSCDEYVLQNMGADIRTDYCRSLLGFATNQRNMAAGLLSFGETDTRKRVKNVLNFKKHGKWIGILAILIITAAGTACLTNAKNKSMKTDFNTDTDSDTKTMKKETIKDKQEAVVASSEIHGYQVKLIYISEEDLTNKNDFEFDMYQGTFELRTYHDQAVCASYPLTFDFTDTLFYPQKGFELIVKDYDGDGDADDFFLGQGQQAIPLLGNFMSYQLYTVDKDGSIARHQFSEDKKSLLTIPGEYSKDFKCKNGQITYQAVVSNKL